MEVKTPSYVETNFRILVCVYLLIFKYRYHSLVTSYCVVTVNSIIKLPFPIEYQPSNMLVLHFFPMLLSSLR